MIRDPIKLHSVLLPSFNIKSQQVIKAFNTYSKRTDGKLLLLEISKSHNCAGADPGFFLGGGALVSCCTSTPINPIVFFFFFFFTEYQLYLKTAGHLRWRGAHPLHPRPRSAPAAHQVPTFAGCLKCVQFHTCNWFRLH